MSRGRRKSYKGKDGMYDAKLKDVDKAGRHGEVVSGLGKMVYSNN